MPLCFEAEGTRIRGRCINVSQSGLLAIFDQVLDIWIAGELSFSLAEYQFNIKARVVRLEGQNTGLAFVNKSDADQRTVRMLMDLVSAPT